MGEARAEAGPDRIGYGHEHDRDCRSLVGQSAGYGCGVTKDSIGPKVDELFCERLHPIRIASGPANFDTEIAAFRPAQLRKRIAERRDLRLQSRILLRIPY